MPTTSVSTASLAAAQPVGTETAPLTMRRSIQSTCTVSASSPRAPGQIVSGVRRASGELGVGGLVARSARDVCTETLR